MGSPTKPSTSKRALLAAVGCTGQGLSKKRWVARIRRVVLTREDIVATATTHGIVANLVIVNVVGKNGLRISTGRFMRYSVPYIIVTLGNARVNVALRYVF